jgi:hypothetical protein
VVWTPLTRDNIEGVLLLAALTAVVATALRFLARERSEADGYIGWFVVGWVVAGCLVWGLAEIAVSSGSKYTPMCAFGGIGFGVVVGNIVGRVAWAYRERRQDEGEEQ